MKGKIREAKNNYRRNWSGNSMREVSSGMKTITGFRPSNSRGTEGSEDRAKELNVFFSRFNTAVNVHLTYLTYL